jgi:Flp pilus assembly protein TadD
MSWRNRPERIPEAIHQLDTALQLDPANAMGHNNLAAMLAKNSGTVAGFGRG